MRRLVVGFNKGEKATLAVIDELYADDIVFHNANGAETHGIRDFKKQFSEFYAAFPDAHFILHDVIVEGDKVVGRWTMSGTHKGELQGIPPTNKKMSMWMITIDRIAGGKFVEAWERSDTLGLMQQLGVIPKPT